MLTFTFTAREDQGVEFDGTSSTPKHEKVINNIYNKNFYVLSNTLNSDRGLALFIDPIFEFDYDYKNITYNSDSNLLRFNY